MQENARFFKKYKNVVIVIQDFLFIFLYAKSGIFCV